MWLEFGYSKQSEDLCVLYHLILLEIFKARRFVMGFFGVLLQALGIFWVLIFAPIRSPLLPGLQARIGLVLFSTVLPFQDTCFAF